jgi:hypothetical protein
MRDTALQDAQHEAAHVVVGVTLGLRLSRATIAPADPEALGLTEWAAPWPREADLLMTAAGVAWERRAGDLAHAAFDLRALRRMGVRGNARLVALERAAWAVLESRAALHARVTRALLEGDVTPRVLRTLVRGICDE